MATRRRAAARKPATTRPSRARSKPAWSTRLTPDVVRSIIGLVLLVLGAMTLIALLPRGASTGEGTLTSWWTDVFAPWFGTMRWVVPFFFLIAGWWLEWGPGTRPGIGLGDHPARSRDHLRRARRGSPDPGDLGRPAGTCPRRHPDGPVHGAGGLRPAHRAGRRRHHRGLRDPAPAADQAGRGHRPLDGHDRGGVPQADARRGGRGRDGATAAAAAAAATATNGRKDKPVPVGPGKSPGQTGAWDDDTAIPAAVPSAAPNSATFAPARGPAGAVAATALLARPLRDPFDVTDGTDSPPTKDRIEYVLPPVAILDDIAIPLHAGGDETAHLLVEDIIVKKLASFGIPVRIVGRNAGPVVTQYEVQPAADIKLSRIEALSDDLSMALAARSLRIEAPIPGKSAVGIEIPNKDFNVVALRRILEELDFKASGSTLTFALGRDVAGKAQAVDLAKMPHLLIAGATGSGKSVMVNALITSLLCEATPDDVRMILMDLKRVELAAYNGLPHLLVPVITEPERAKAALKWAVNEMEARYRRLAGATARNIRAFNETRVDPEDRMPYIVIVIDELADLMMREGKNVEDPIVRLAQKARATGIHMVLATQRPSVNVVTGLIKANFPSRIAFAMASQIDSRTILDAPGAEDLIGRGDMLYQPSDLPRPMRLQGVFVSDAEIARVVDHWKAQIEDPHYDMAIIDTGDEGTGSVDDLADEDADRLLPDAIEVIREYDRASASLLQRRLKVGYARAARMIDQLEARGYIGAFDGSNARQVLRRDDTSSPAGTPDDGLDGGDG